MCALHKSENDSKNFTENVYLQNFRKIIKKISVKACSMFGKFQLNSENNFDKKRKKVLREHQRIFEKNTRQNFLSFKVILEKFWKN